MALTYLPIIERLTTINQTINLSTKSQNDALLLLTVKKFEFGNF
jgi:hypothetical protein